MGEIHAIAHHENRRAAKPREVRRDRRGARHLFVEQHAGPDRAGPARLANCLGEGEREPPPSAWRSAWAKAGGRAESRMSSTITTSLPSSLLSTSRRTSTSPLECVAAPELAQTLKSHI